MIPPTSAALLQHTKRAAYQSGQIWGQCLVPIQKIPCPSEEGTQYVFREAGIDIFLTRETGIGTFS